MGDLYSTLPIIETGDALIIPADSMAAKVAERVFGTLKGAEACRETISRDMLRPLVRLAEEREEYRRERDDARKELATKLSAMRDELDLVRTALADEERRRKESDDAKDRNIAIAIDSSRRCDAAEAKVEREHARAEDNWRALQTAKSELATAEKERDAARQLAETLRLQLQMLSGSRWTDTARTSSVYSSVEEERAATARHLDAERDRRVRLLANIIEAMSDDEGEAALLCGFIREELDR